MHQADTQIFLNATFKTGSRSTAPARRSGSSAATTFRPVPDAAARSSANLRLPDIRAIYGVHESSLQPQLNSDRLRRRHADAFDANYSWGPFGDNYVHLFTLVTSRPIGRRMTLGLEYDGTYERPLTGDQPLDSQWLRRISLGYNLSAESSVTLSYRSINGLGGFATQTRAELRLRVSRPVSRGERAVRQLWVAGGFDHVEPADREVRVSCGGRRRHVIRLSQVLQIGPIAGRSRFPVQGKRYSLASRSRPSVGFATRPEARLRTDSQNLGQADYFMQAIVYLREVGFFGGYGGEDLVHLFEDFGVDGEVGGGEVFVT